MLDGASRPARLSAQLNRLLYDAPLAAPFGPATVVSVVDVYAAMTRLGDGRVPVVRLNAESAEPRPTVELTSPDEPTVPILMEADQPTGDQTATTVADADVPTGNEPADDVADDVADADADADADEADADGWAAYEPAIEVAEADAGIDAEAVDEETTSDRPPGSGESDAEEPTAYEPAVALAQANEGGDAEAIDEETTSGQLSGESGADEPPPARREQPIFAAWWCRHLRSRPARRAEVTVPFASEPATEGCSPSPINRTTRRLHFPRTPSSVIGPVDRLRPNPGRPARCRCGGGHG